MSSFLLHYSIFFELNTLDACWIVVNVWSNSSRCRQESVYTSWTWSLYNYHCLDIVMIIWSSINCPIVICSPAALLFFSREATSGTYDPRISFSYFFAFEIYFYLHLFSDLLIQKPKNTLLHFILFAIYLFNLLQLYPFRVMVLEIAK